MNGTAVAMKLLRAAFLGADEVKARKIFENAVENVLLAFVL